MQSSSTTGSPILLLLLLLAGIAIVALLFLRRDGPAPGAASRPSPMAGAGKGWIILGGATLVLVAAFGVASFNRGSSQSPAAPQGGAILAANPVAAAPVTPEPTYAPAAPAEQALAPPTASAAVVPATYACSAFMGVLPNGHLQSMPGFTIAADGGYTHEQGSSGTVSVVQGVLEFHGGALDGQAATFDAGSGGKGSVHLFNESRSRTVIDCDG